jgi:pimeloyl-ACP methyl ester carboxylesterase
MTADDDRSVPEVGYGFRPRHVHWANRHPDEVAAIVGLDPAVPPIYEVMPPQPLMVALVSFTGQTGLLRLAPSVCLESPAADYLTEAELSAYCSLTYRRTLSADMRAEVKANQANAQRVAAEGIPDVPLYVFISDGNEVPVDNWGEVLADYVEAAGGQYQVLDVGHYVHTEAPDLIAEGMRTFLQQHEDSFNFSLSHTRIATNVATRKMLANARIIQPNTTE